MSGFNTSSTSLSIWCLSVIDIVLIPPFMLQNMEEGKTLDRTKEGAF